METRLETCIAGLLARAGDDLRGYQLAPADKALLSGNLVPILIDRGAYRAYVRDLLGLVGPGGCRHASPLPEDRLGALIAQGSGALTDGELAALMLNPMALGVAHTALERRLSAGPEGPLADEWFAAADEDARRLAERDGVGRASPGPVESRRDLSDPAEGPGESRTAAGRFPGHAARALRFPRGRVRAVVGLAASLLVGVGLGILVVQWVRGPAVPDIAFAEVIPQVPVVKGQATGKTTVEGDRVYHLETRGDFQLLIRSPRAGYVTVVLCTPQSADLFPRPGTPPVRVEPGVVWETPALPLKGRTTVFVLVTTTPGAESIKSSLPQGGVPPTKAQETLDEVVATLTRAGNHVLAANRITAIPDHEE
jgi:hypothetical protein